MGLSSDSLPIYAFLETIVNFKKTYEHDAARYFWILTPVNQCFQSSFSALLFHSCFWVRCKTAQLHWTLLLPPVEAGGWPEWPCHYTFSEATLSVELSWRPRDPNAFASWWRRDPDPHQSLCKWERNFYCVRQKWLSSLNVIWFGKKKKQQKTGRSPVPQWITTVASGTSEALLG